MTERDQRDRPDGGDPPAASNARQSGRGRDTDSPVSRESAAREINPGDEGSGVPDPAEPDTEA